MKTVQLLEANDTIEATDWCRPLQLMSMSGGFSDSYAFESCYTGHPENNAKWLQVLQIFGEGWVGKTVKDINNEGIPYEILRGDIPETSKYGKTKRDIREEQEAWMCSAVIKFGKHKGQVWGIIKQKDPDWFNWAENQGLVPYPE